MLTAGVKPPLLLCLGQLLDLGLDPVTPAAAADAVRETSSGLSLWFRDRGRIIASLEKQADRYERLALEWLDSQADHPWQRDAHGQPQIVLAPEESTPQSTYSFEWPSGYAGEGVWRPRHGGLWTTSPVDRVPTPNNEAETNRCEVDQTLSISPNARIYEIRARDDWRRLVASYPARVEDEPLELTLELTLPAPLLLPDWKAVGVDWDAVRLTMSGILQTLYVLMQVDDAFTILHQDESTEETLWLNWGFEERLSCAGTA